ncbi:HAD family hydrolase [Polycladidibacter hongkongensis]|uniref:HAD family hydrolase n=1 Tax=Polycladidibacter hongkongensis TaxID=1647556 RepID=UPI000833C1DC|nr:HAD family hydrolase [Pseudovibrio hongkongensis]
MQLPLAKKLSHIRVIAFDKDGTLFDFDQTWINFSQAMLHALAPDDTSLKQRLGDIAGFDVETHKFVPGALVVAGSTQELCEAWLPLLPAYDLDRLMQLAEHVTLSTRAVPVCDLPLLLSGLKRHKIQLAVITNDLEASARQQTRDAGVEDEFAMILGFDSGGQPKPAGDMLLRVCDKCNIVPHELMMVGDSLHDFTAARAAGAGVTLGVLTGPATREDLAGSCDFVAQSIAEIPALLGLATC